MRRNLARLHMRNFRCAFAVCVKLRGFCALGGTSGALGGGIVSLGGRGWSFFFSAFRGTRWLLSVIETSVFAFVYIFRSVGGVLSTWQHRAVGGSSDGGVKGIPLNNPLFG